KLVRADGCQTRGEAAQPRQRCAGGDRAPDLLVRTRRRSVRSRRTEPVDGGPKAVVGAQARPDVQHPVTSAHSGAARATVTVRIARFDEMLHLGSTMFN